MNCHYLC